MVVQSKKREQELDGEQLAANLFQELIKSEKERLNRKGGELDFNKLDKITSSVAKVSLMVK